MSNTPVSQQPLRTGTRISEKIIAASKDASSPPFWSLEFFPPKTAQGLANLYARIARMREELDPAWVQVTWGAGGTTGGRSLEMAGRVQQGRLAPRPPVVELRAESEQSDPTTAGIELGAGGQGCDTCLHLTCTNVQKESLDATLDQAKKLGIRNILALRGDPPRGQEYWVAADDQFQHATDLVRYIRQHYGDFFCIGVAGYPEGHADVDRNVDRDIEYLKLKQDVGAEFVVTQLFYDVDQFIDWYKRCRQAGITIPIIPGIMPIHNYQSFRRMTNLCKARVPQEVLDGLEPIRFDDAAVKDYGVQLSIDMISRLCRETDIRGFHLCTLNLEKSIRRMLQTLGWVKGDEPPFERSALDGPDGLKVKNQMISDRTGQATPPSLKTSSEDALSRTLARTSVAWPGPETATWDEFPNGRWGDSRSPAYGEMDGYGASLKIPPDEARRHWGYPVSVSDISSIFISYLLGQTPAIPWCDEPLFNETLAIRPHLLSLNSLAPELASSSSSSAAAAPGSSNGVDNSKPRISGAQRGWWTVGSQPAVDGVSSSDPTYGFGPKDGYVFQKAFVEFFVDEKDKDELAQRIEEEGEGFISYFAGNREGTFETNMKPNEVNAVTWGVFPGKEIIQSTIIEEQSFKAWRDEAFAIWAEWESLYPTRSATHDLLHSIGENRWLVTVVHHDYKRENALWEFLGCGEAVGEGR